jgi:hypothetical protein
MIKVIQANCKVSADIMTPLMSAAVQGGAAVVLIKEPTVKKVKDKWKVKIWDGNYVYIYSGDNDRPYEILTVRKMLCGITMEVVEILNELELRLETFA